MAPDDSAQARLFQAFRSGMSLDSLYFNLAARALENLSLDTAMAFNLSIPTPPGGAFRDSVLRQRHRLYVLSGLHEDARRLKDSLPALRQDAPERRVMEWEFKLLSGYSREDQSSARIYPSGADLGSLETGGWKIRNQGLASIPLPVPDAFPMGIGVGYDLSKSYYKDSLDYRAGLRLKADRVLGRFSAALSLEAGRVTGLGSVAAVKGDLTFLALGESGFLLANAGVEGEWERFRADRYQAAWITLYKEWGLRDGRAVQGSLSGSALRMEPLRVPGTSRVMFVDDVTKERPTHYRDGAYQDSLPGNSISTYALYTQSLGTVDFACPQDVIAFGPALGYSFPMPMRLKAEFSGRYALALYPRPFTWLEGGGTRPLPGDTVEFQGYARNRADGRYYPASVDLRSGRFAEAYGPEPLPERRTFRLDHRMGADLALKRPLAGWGALVLDAGVERTYSNLSGRAPVWIPEWDYGVSLRWTRTGRWP